MRNPIRIEGAGAARPIHYPLRGRRALAGAQNARRGVSPRRLRSLVTLLGLLALGCGDAGDHDAVAAQPSAAAEVARIEAATVVPSGSLARAADTEGDANPSPASPVVVFLGTSLTAGYGLEESQAFPALIGERIEAAGLGYRVINAGVSGDTSAGGLRRLSWLLRMPVGVLVLELGANDMLRGQSADQLEANLREILSRTAEAHPGVRFVIAGMRAAPNLGREYGDRFDAIYPALAREYDAAFVPFLLEDVAARRHLNQADGIHPTAEGHALIAERVWKTLEPVLRGG